MDYAHSTEREDRADWQSLVDHLRTVAELAGDRGSKFGARKAAELSGWLHDLGKYSSAFQAYIGGRGQSVDHSTAGAREAMKLAAPRTMDKLIAELVAYAIAGHHAGLPDREGGPASLSDRIKHKKLPMLGPVWTTEVGMDSDDLFPPQFAFKREQAAFQLALLGRMIFSCLVDADYLDTENHYAQASREPVDRKWLSLRDNVDGLISAFDSHMQRKLAAIPEVERDTPLNILRRNILAHVRDKASMSRGVFTLEVPTGGGKTLASLAFALEHVKHWNMDRIVYSIPFTSIIDQTTDIFRAVLGERWVRNYTELAKGELPGYRIYVQEGSILNDRHREAYKAKRPDDETVEKAPKLNPRNGDEAKAITKFMCDNFFDVRTFGAVMSTGINAGQVRGPVQVAFASSVEKILPLEISITRMAATNEKEKAEREKNGSDERTENRTMGRKHIVPYGLYRTHIFVNAKLAERTGFGEADLAHLFESLKTMFEHDRPAARGEMASRRVIAFKHASALGNAPAHKLFERVKVQRKVGDDLYDLGSAKLDNYPPARAYADYVVAVDGISIPDGVEIVDVL